MVKRRFGREGVKIEISKKISSCTTRYHSDLEYTKFSIVRLAVVEKSRGQSSGQIRFEVQLKSFTSKLKCFSLEYVHYIIILNDNIVSLVLVD